MPTSLIESYNLSQLQEVYDQIDVAFSQHQQACGLSCLPECGQCCLSNDVVAGRYEMLPLALALWQQGQAEAVLAQLSALDMDVPEDRACIMYQKSSVDGRLGRCGVYQHRPLLCRVFGVYARRNKYQQKELSVCKLIAENNGLTPERRQAIAQEAPEVALWRKRVEELNPTPSGPLLPINQALREALDYVLMKTQYQVD